LNLIIIQHVQLSWMNLKTTFQQDLLVSSYFIWLRPTAWIRILLINIFIWRIRFLLWRVVNLSTISNRFWLFSLITTKFIHWICISFSKLFLYHFWPHIWSHRFSALNWWWWYLYEISWIVKSLIFLEHLTWRRCYIYVDLAQLLFSLSSLI